MNARIYARNNVARMSGYVPGEQPDSPDVIKLNTNENPYPPCPGVQELLTHFDTATLRRYPNPVCQEIRDEVARQNGLKSDWVLCGNGSDDLLTIAVRSFVDPGSALAYPSPTYSLYAVLAQIQDTNVVEIELDDNLQLPTDTLAQAHAATLLFVARPNAPTGTTYSLEAMAKLCEGFNGIVWFDEAYADFADDDCLSLVRNYSNAVVSRTLSKSASLAGIRLGYCIANPTVTEQMMKVKDSYNVNAITQALALAAIRDQSYMRKTCAKICKTREETRDALCKLGFEVLPSQTNFLFAKPPVPAQAYFQALKAYNILIRYFDATRTQDYVRISIGTDAEMTRLLEATQTILTKG